jgi:serine protease
MLQKQFVCVLLSSVLGASAIGTGGSNSSSAIAQTKIATDIEVQSQPELFYLYNGEKIPLQVRPNEIAVAFKPPVGGRRTLGQELPLYQQLQTRLNQGGVRGGQDAVEVRPVGTNYAIVKFSAGRRDVGGTTRQIQDQSYVQSSLPVLSRTDRVDAIVLTPEIIISFQPNTPESEQKAILKAQNLELIRPLRFTQNRYLVKATSATGTSVLTVANRLNQVAGVTSASPNFLQVLPNRTAFRPDPFLKTTTPSPTVGSRGGASTPYASDLWPLLWHLDSRSRRPNAPRTDVRAPEAWQQSSGGQGVVVAVMDNLIQWDHPNLAKSLYQPATIRDRLPGEVSGWDFAQDDADTRISDEEMATLRPTLQSTFQLADDALLAQYETWAKTLQTENPKASTAAIAAFIRRSLRGEIAGSFHGTQTSAIIAAQPVNGKGMVGVAPNAKILPVRVGKLGNGIETVAVIEGVGYAAQRGAEVINMSFGGLMPTTEENDAIVAVLAANPKLVIVVSSGNEAFERPGFPALVKGTIAVGATSLTGNRAPYSNYGLGLDLVAPGGDTDRDLQNGMLTASGLGTAGFWQGLPVPTQAWLPAQDLAGLYQWTQGTSFSAPTVAGVVALMKGEDKSRQLSRDRMIAILKSTAGYGALQLSPQEKALYQTLKSTSKLPPPVTVNQYFFGSGLVNAAAAVQAVQRSLK